MNKDSLNECLECLKLFLTLYQFYKAEIGPIERVIMLKPRRL